MKDINYFQYCYKQSMASKTVQISDYVQEPGTTGCVSAYKKVKKDAGGLVHV